MGISSREVWHNSDPINIEQPEYTMLIGFCIIVLLLWRLPRQSADWLAMTMVVDRYLCHIQVCLGGLYHNQVRIAIQKTKRPMNPWFPWVGARDGTRYIIVSIPSSRNRASVYRTLAFNHSSPISSIKISATP